MAYTDEGIQHYPPINLEFGEIPPNNFMILYRRLNPEENAEILSEGIKIKENTVEDIAKYNKVTQDHIETMRLIEEARIAAGIEGFERNKVIYAHLTPNGHFVKDSDGVIEVAVDPKDCLVCDLETYANVYSAVVFSREGLGTIDEAKELVAWYWAKAKQLSQMTEEEIINNEETLEVLIKTNIPKEFIRRHTA